MKGRALFVVGMLVTAGCATARPMTASPTLYTLPTESPKELSNLEEQLGAVGQLAMSQRFLEEFNPAVDNRLTRIGNRLTHYSERPNVPYQYRYLDTFRAGAYSMPNGTIYLTRGLLEALHEDDQLAGIMAHEISHITHQHLVKAYHRQFSAGRVLGSMLAATATTLIGRPDLGVWLVQQAAEQGYSQQQELQADIMALRYLIRSGYGPTAYFEAMECVRHRAANDPPDPTQPMTFFATHPGWRDRVRALREALPRIEQEERVRYDPKDFAS